MGIGSYKEAQRYRMRTNKNLTRSFYLDTRRTLDEEPFAWEQPQDAGIMQPEAVQEFSDGGSVKRQGFQTGGDVGINRIADAFLKSYAEDDISYLTSKSEFNKKGMLSPSQISFYRTKIKSPTFVQDIVDKTGLKAEDVLDLMDERENFIELDLKPTIAGESKKNITEKINQSIDQGENWLIKNSKNYDNVEDLKKGFKRVFGKDHPFLKQTLRTSYGMPKLNQLFFEEKKKIYQTHGSPAFVYGTPEMKNLFQASLYNFNPIVRDKVLNELNDILPKTKITESQKYDLRKKFENSKVLSELGINKRLSGPVTRLLIKDIGENVVEDINFIKYPRTQVGHYINFLKDKVEPKYRKQFDLVNKAIRQINYRNYDGAKETLGIVENINLDHRVPKYLIDAGYADEIEYIKLNPIGENFNMIAKNKNFDAPIARLTRKYEVTTDPKEKSKIVEEMNQLKNNFNKRYNNYLSDISIKEIDGKLNVSSSLKPITSANEFIKTLETNVKENPELFKITEQEKKAINLLNRVNFGADPNLVKELYGREINIVKNLINKVPAPVRAVGKIFGIGDIVLETILAAPDVLQGDIEAAKRGSIFGLFGYGKELDEELLEQAKNKESVQRAIQNLKLTPELRNLMEEKKNIEESLFKGNLDTEQASILSQNLNTIDSRIKEINNYLSKNEYLEEDETNFLNTAFDLAKLKAKKAEEMFGPQFKQAQGPTLEQTLFKKILDEEGYSELIPEESKQKIAGTYTPIEIPEIQSPDDSMREGFKKGGISKRGFLKLLGGTAATGAIAPDLIKALKGGKKATQTGRAASKLKFEKAEGMYSWFPDLVEKIKVKGKPFEEKELIMEASYKHEAKGYGGMPKGVEKLTKHVDGDTEFILREYPDGRIAVDIHSPRNQEGLDTPVTLYYRPTMELKYYSGTKVEPAEFKVLEKQPRYFANGPDDVDIEMSEMRKVPGKDTIFGDVEAAERFATGNIKNRKIIPAKQARRDQMEDAPVDFIEETTNYGPVYD